MKRIFFPSLLLDRRSTRLLILCCALLTGVVSPRSLIAQASNAAGTIQGTIMDSSGAVVPDAKIIITEPSTGSQKVFTASASGYYSAGSMLPGQYNIHVDAPGFSATDQSVTVQIGVVTNGDIKLGVSGQTAIVEVKANAVAVDTSQTQIAGVLTLEQIQSLPLNGRNFLDLAQLQPGVQIQDGTNFDPTKNGFSSISFGGRFGRTARISLDGLDISDENVGTTTQNISADAIQEFQVAQSNLDISTSITSSGSVNVISRSGSNTLHGDAFYNFRDKRAGGANFPGGQDNPLQRNNTGGALGGPIKPGRAFYFGSVENFTQHLDAPVSLAGTPLDNLSGSYSSPYKELELLGRLDFNLPRGAHGFLRSALHNNKDVAGFGGGNNYSPYLNENNTPNVGGGLDFLTGNFSHSVRVGYFKFVNHITDAPAVTDDPAYNKTPGIFLVIGAYTSGASFLAPQTTIQSNKQFKYDGSWTKGRHTIRYGAGVNHILGGGFASFYGIDPQVQLGPNVVPGGDPGNPLDYLVAPAPGQSSTILIGNGEGFGTELPQFGFPGGGQRDWRFTAYVGDQWKINSRINFNYGLRYIRDTGRSDSDLPAIPLLDSIAPGLGNKVNQPNKNFGPQAGIAWDVTGRGKTVVRAGAGIYYENNVWNNILFDRPARLQQGLFFGLAPVCGPTSVTVPTSNGGTTQITTIDGTSTGTPIASICGAALGATVGGVPVYQDIATLQKTYQSLVKQAGAQGNGAYIGSALAVGPNSTGDMLFNPNYKTPGSYQMNIGVQQEVAKNTVLTVDYVRNTGFHFLVGIDENHVGDVANFNPAAANAAVAATVAACGVANVAAAIQACPGLHPGSNGSPAGPAVLSDFAVNGLDSLNQGNGGLPNPNFAFQGQNPTFGQAFFLTPTARSSYNALQINVTQRSSHPFKGVVSTDLTASYTYSHFSGTGTSVDTSTGPLASGGDQDFGETSLNSRNPNQFFGPNSLDRRQQFSIGLDTDVWKGLHFDTIAHLYSSLPLSLALPTVGSGDIFTSDFIGSGTPGNILPGTNIGSYNRGIKPGNLNTVINNYNSKYVGTLTPAGNAVVGSGALTAAQLVQIGGSPQPIFDAPSNAIGNDILRIWDVGVSYNFKIGETLSIQPAVHAFNILNAANFDGPGGLGSSRQAGVLAGALNPSPSAPTANTTTAANQGVYRLGLGTGVYAFGAPRQLEFGLKATF